MDAPAPRISIVTPCLNARERIGRALDSVRDQGLEGVVEHIVADAGSTDGTVEVIAAHERHLARWTSRPDMGQSDAINQALAGAQGEFAGWLNADDWYEPGGLAPIVKAIEDSPEADVIVGRCRFVNDAGDTVWRPVPPDPIDLASLLRLRSMWFAGRSIAQPEAFFRLTRFKKVGGLNLDNHHSMDYELWIRFLEAGARFVSIDAPVACIGVHEGQKTADNRAAVRSVLKVARPAAERHAQALGPSRDEVNAELAAMASKLERSDRLLAIWKGEVSACDDLPRACSPWIAEARGVEARIRCEFILGDQLRRTGRLRRARRADVLVVSPFADEIAKATYGGRRLSPHPHRPTDPIDDDTDRWDAIVVESSLLLQRRPAEFVSSLWRSLRVGGVLSQWGEPAATPAIDEYIAWLRRRLDVHLSTDDDVLLDARIDDAIERLLADPASATLPGARGINDKEVFATMENAERLELLRYGTLGPHPLFPFEFIGPEPLGRKAAWVASVWIKRA